MSKEEKLALLGFIFFMTAFSFVSELYGKLIWLFFAGLAAYQFFCPTKRAADLCQECGTPRIAGEDRCRVCGTSR